MVKIQIDLTEGEDKIVEIYKAKNRIETKELAVKKMIQKFSECKHKFEVFKERKFRAYQGNLEIDYVNVIQRCPICGDLREDLVRL